MSTKIMTLAENGIPINTVLVGDLEPFPLTENQTLVDPAILSYKDNSDETNT